MTGCGIGVDGDATVTAGGNGGGERDQLAGLVVEPAGLHSGRAERPITFHGFRAQLADVTDPRQQLALIGLPVQHCRSPRTAGCREMK
jgi:hypothetical protein